MPKRLRVALVFGGRSGEHEVSVISARSVASAIDRERFEVVAMAVDRAGRWADPATASALLAAEGRTPDTVPDFSGESALDGRLLAGEVDVVLPILHGPFGEDGTIQGLCEMLDLPYAGCSVAASAVTMDKVLTKRLLFEAGLPTPRFVAVGARQWAGRRDETLGRCQDLGLPLFVKPCRLGSSVGISKVKSAGQLAPALDRAFVFDDVAIVEEGIPAREIEIAVLDGDPPLASLPGEVIPGHEFYDYADKYLDDACRLVAPAPLDGGATAEVQRLALAAFHACGCEGMARVDFLLDQRDGRILVNELNSIPGFTSISMYPRLLGLSGMPYGEVITRLIEGGLARHLRRRRYAEAALAPLDDRTRTQ